MERRGGGPARRGGTRRPVAGASDAAGAACFLEEPRDGPADGPREPGRIAEVAREHGCESVAFTYDDPVIFAEYAIDTADACHALGVKTVAVTAGYIHDAPRREFFAKMDAANIDLKGFSEELDAMTRWIVAQLGPDVPLHFTAFHPDHRMTDVAPTPAATLTRARRIALDNGLRHDYTGNVHDREGGATSCPGCAAAPGRFGRRRIPVRVAVR